MFATLVPGFPSPYQGLGLTALAAMTPDTQVGQLIVAIAIVDDIFALVVLSQLRALTGDEITTSSIVIPIISALLWLGIGGYVALYIMPRIFDYHHQRTRLAQLCGHDRRRHEHQDPPHDNDSDILNDADQQGDCNDSSSSLLLSFCVLRLGRNRGLSWLPASSLLVIHANAASISFG